jgi:hypothetical protein
MIKDVVDGEKEIKFICKGINFVRPCPMSVGDFASRKCDLQGSHENSQKELDTLGLATVYQFPF